MVKYLHNNIYKHEIITLNVNNNNNNDVLHKFHIYNTYNHIPIYNL